MSQIDNPNPATSVRPPQPVAAAALNEVWRRVRAHHLVLLTIPWLLFLINASWPFQGLGGMDPWYYFGHFIHFPHYQQLNPTYAGERLAWLLPGILLNRIFQPAYAELVLHFCCYWIALFSLYYLVRRLTNDATALLAAVLMGSYPMFIAANGSTYVDSGCIVYLLLAFVCLTRSRSASHKAVWLIVAGACWAALVYTYLFWIVLTPCCAIFYFGLTAESGMDGRRLMGVLPVRYPIAAGQFLGGTLLATVALQITHLLVHGMGHGFFFHYNIALAVSLGSSDNPFAQPDYAWIASNACLVFPAVTFVVCLAGLLLHRSGRRRLDGARLGILWAYVYSFLVLVFFTVYRTQILQFSYYDSILIPLFFLVLAVTALPVPKQLPQWLFGAVLAIGFSLSTLSLWKAGLYVLGLPGRLWLHCVIAAVGTMLPLLSVRRSVWVVSVVCLAGASFGLVPQYASLAWVVNYDGLDVSIRVGDAIRRIEAFLPYNTYPVFWIDDFTSQYSAEYRAIMCAFVSHNLSMWHYPKVGVGAASLPAKYPAGTPIVLITERQDVFERAQTAMADMGMPLRLTGQQLVSRDNLSYWLTFVEVVNPAEEPGAVADAVRVPFADGLQLAYPNAALERVGQSWRVVTASQQWAYAADVPFPTVNTERWHGTVRIRGRVVRGRVGFGLLNRFNQFAIEQFVEGPSKETELSLPADFSDDIGTVMVRNGGAGGPGEVVLDSIDLALAGRKVTDFGESGSITTASAGVSVSRGRPATILWAAGTGSGAASIPLSLKKRSRGLFYLEVKAQVQTGKVTVEVVDSNNKDQPEKRVMDKEGVPEDFFVRIPAGLQQGEVDFRNAAGAGIHTKCVVLDVVLWEVI